MVGQRSNPTERVVRVLETLRAHPGEGLRFADLVRGADVSQATGHAILLTLVDAGYVVRDEGTRTFTLGPAIVGLGTAAQESFPAVRAAAADLAALARRTGLPCSAARVVEQSITVLDVIGAEDATLPLGIGTRVPFAPPFGAIHVAWSGDDEIDAWIARAPRPTLSRARLLDVIEDHRRTHLAVAPYTPSSSRLREALGELAVDALASDVRERTLELLATIDELDYTRDALLRAEALPVNTLTAPVFDGAASTAFAVALHLADPALAISTVTDLGAELLATTEKITADLGGRLPERPLPERGGTTLTTATGRARATV
jgi:DNA-binding IclR family transcriptional regulator